MPAPLLPTEILDYTGLTRLGLEDRLQTLYKQVNPNYDDYSCNFPENLLLHGMALIGSLIAGVADERVRQLSWATVTDRLAAIRLGKPAGYQFSGRTLASCTGAFSLPNSALATKTVLIPAETKVMSDNIVFTSAAAMNIAIGSNASASGSVGNTEEQSDSFTAYGEANQSYQLQRTPVIDGGTSPFTVQDSGGLFTDINPSTGQVWSSFMEMGPDTRGFIARKDSNGKVWFFFGNGVYGACPTGTLQITYKTGGGESENNVDAGAQWTVLDTIYDSDGGEVTVVFNNTTASQGGTDETTVEEAKVLGPLAVRTINRAVNEDDCEYAARTVTGVARAALMTSNHDAGIQEDEAYLYLVAYGSAYSASGYYPPSAPTQAQIDEVEALFTSTGAFPQLMGVVITVHAAVLYTVNIKVKIYKKANYTADQVKDNIVNSLQKFFAVADADRAQLSNVDFGYKLLGSDGTPDYKVAWSWVFNAINDAEGVREVSFDDQNLLIAGAKASLILQPKEFPILGSIQVYDMDQGGIEI